MKALFIIFITLVLSRSVFAQDRRAVKQHIQDISMRIERDVPYSEAVLSDLQEAKRLLHEASQLIANRGGGGGNSQVYKECINFAFQKYKRELDSSTALTRAQNNCIRVSDMAVLKYLFTQHYRSHGNSKSMDLSTMQADRRVLGRLALIKFAYQKHYRSFDSSTSATKAVRNMQGLQRNRGSLNCFNKYYPIHYRAHDSSVAMDKTIESCRRF